jgi:hypothetical protein
MATQVLVPDGTLSGSVTDHVLASTSFATVPSTIDLSAQSGRASRVLIVCIVSASTPTAVSCASTALTKVYEWDTTLGRIHTWWRLDSPSTSASASFSITGAGTPLRATALVLADVDATTPDHVTANASATGSPTSHPISIAVTGQHLVLATTDFDVVTYEFAEDNPGPLPDTPIVGYVGDGGPNRLLLMTAGSGGPTYTRTLTTTTGRASQSSALALRVVPRAMRQAWLDGVGINFRETAGFVTDGANEIAAAGNYRYGSRPLPGGLGIGHTGVPYGPRNRDSGTDRRLAGAWNDADGGTAVRHIRIDVPEPGVYELRGAFGDRFNSGTMTAAIVDSDRTTVLHTVADGVSFAGGQFFDITGTLRTSVADWVDNQGSTFVAVSGPCLYVRFGTNVSQVNSAINHLWLRQVPMTPSSGTAHGDTSDASDSTFVTGTVTGARSTLALSDPDPAFVSLSGAELTIRARIAP